MKTNFYLNGKKLKTPSRDKWSSVETEECFVKLNLEDKIINPDMSTAKEVCFSNKDSLKIIDELFNNFLTKYDHVFKSFLICNTSFETTIGRLNILSNE